jgi:hypothetical protein
LGLGHSLNAARSKFPEIQVHFPNHSTLGFLIQSGPPVFMIPNWADAFTLLMADIKYLLELVAGKLYYEYDAASKSVIGQVFQSMWRHSYVK